MCLESSESCEMADGRRDYKSGLAAYVRRSLSLLFLHVAEMSRGKYRVFRQSLTSEQKEKVLFKISWVIAPSIICRFLLQLVLSTRDFSNLQPL